MENPQNDRGRLQQKLFYYNILGMLVISILVAAAAIIPLFDSLLQQEYQNLEFSQAQQHDRTEQYFNSLRNIAEQITSRSQIRQELERYNAGKIPLTDLQEFSGPKLLDALTYSPAAKGISRYDQAGRKVVSVGLDYEHPEQVNQSWRDGDVSVDGPVFIQGDPYFLVTAPIRNRKKLIVGKDEVLFTIEGLSKIAQQYSNDKKNSYFLLAYKQGDIFSWLPLQQNSQIEIPITGETETLLADAEAGKTGVTTMNKPILGFGKPVVAYGAVSKADSYPLLIIADSEGIYANVYKTVLKVCGAIVALLTLTGTGLVLLLKPLKDKALLYQQELEKEVHTLQDILPVCMYCKNIRNDDGYWDRIESYLAKLSDVKLSHGICDDCLKEHYPDIFEKNRKNA